MNNIFLVTSGLVNNYGVLSFEDKFQQTLETAISIKKYSPNSKIILLEGGQSSLSYIQRCEIRKKYDDILDYTYHPTIKFAHGQKVNVMYTKGPCEALMMYETCGILPKEGQYRIYKISGRYTLNENFDESAHQKLGKYVYKTKQSGVKYYHDGKNSDGSQLQNIEDYFTPYQYKTRLYSFCSTLLNRATEDHMNIFSCMVNSYINHGYIDVEHSHYRCIPPDFIHELDVIGLSGVQAPNGVAIKE